MSETQGGRFSQIYVAKGEPTEDSERMRLRLYSLFVEQKLSDTIQPHQVELVTGAPVPRYSNGYPDWRRFFLNSDLRDLLDAITVIATVVGKSYASYALRWLGGCRVIMREENVRYRIDDKGVVHFAIDAQFTHDQACVIGALSDPRYGAARAHFEAGQKALDSVPAQTRDAIRQTFECVEALFKLRFGVSRLGETEVQKCLQPVISAWPAGTERNAAVQMVGALKDWVTSAHQYRHAQAGPEPDNPSIRTAVLSISLGSAFARWLAELDAERDPKDQTAAA